MDSDSSPQRHSAALGDMEFHVPHVTLLASTKSRR